MKQDTTRWEATGTPGLYVQQPGGGFYARISLNGKRSWRSLKTDKIREAQKLLRDLQFGHTRQLSTRSEDKLHAAMTAVIEFRAVRRGLKNQPLKKTTQAFHADILGSWSASCLQKDIRPHLKAAWSRVSSLTVCLRLSATPMGRSVPYEATMRLPATKDCPRHCAL